MLRKWRQYTLASLLCVAVAGVIWRLIELNVLERPFLLRQSKARILRTVNIPAYRGMITDRNGAPLAISTPVDSVWVNPHLFHVNAEQLHAVSHILSIPSNIIKHKLAKNKSHHFIYLKRDNPPDVVKKLKALKISGIFFQREYRRYYPSGAVSAQVVGITNIDDKGQEGMELAFNTWLAGMPGQKKVVKDRLGHTIADVALLKNPQQGRELQLSIDNRIQFLAYDALEQTIQQFHARSGSVVVLDARSGEVLAMVNNPSYNPNKRFASNPAVMRNRSVTDMFEPGSVIKPFVTALALESKKYSPDTIINTNPGWMNIGGYRIHDDLNYGAVNLTQLLQKSSNIAAAKILLSLNPSAYYTLLKNIGFGARTQSRFPGESQGSLVAHTTWLPSVVATMAYGYGIAVTALQLAQAYTVLANHGVKKPVTFIKSDKSPLGVRVMPAQVAETVLHMLETVVKKGGTGTRAHISGYRVAGKTGTAYIAGPKGYFKHRYVSSFVGIAPVEDPRIVIAVVIREPKGKHFGGTVAAPLFAKIAEGALRLLNVIPQLLS